MLDQRFVRCVHLMVWENGSRLMTYTAIALFETTNYAAPDESSHWHCDG